MTNGSDQGTIWRPGSSAGPSFPSPHKERMTTGHRIGVAIVVVMLIPALIGVLASIFDGDQATQDRSGTTNVSPVKHMTRQERALVADAGYFNDCRALRGDARPEGVVAAIRCDATRTRLKGGEFVPQGTRMSADLFRYPSKQAATKAYWARLDFLRSPAGGATVASEAGWCVQTGFYSPFGCGRNDGRVAFYKRNGHAFALWTAPERVYAEAERFDERLGKLRSLWWDEW